MSIIGIVENKTKQSKSAADLAMAARGGAIAHLFVSHIRDAATSMKRFLVDIQGLTHEGRIGFRTSLGEELKAMRKNLKSAEGTVNEASWKSSMNCTKCAGCGQAAPIIHIVLFPILHVLSECSLIPQESGNQPRLPQT